MNMFYPHRSRRGQPVNGGSDVIGEPSPGRRSIRKTLIALSVAAAAMTMALVGGMTSPASAHDWGYHRSDVDTYYPLKYPNTTWKSNTVVTLHGDTQVLEGTTTVSSKDGRGFYVCVYVKYLHSSGYQFGTSTTHRFGVVGYSSRTYNWSETGPNYWMNVETVQIVQYTC